MISNYSLALFIHIVGALGFFMALGLEWTSMHQMRSAMTVEQVQDWLRVTAWARRLGMAAMMTILAAGFYMMAIAQMNGAWIIVAFWALVLLSVITVVLTGPRITAIRRSVAQENGHVSMTLRRLLDHPLLLLSIQTRVAIALGIIFLMTIKPALIGSLLAVGIATLLGLASALPMLSRGQTQVESGA